MSVEFPRLKKQRASMSVNNKWVTGENSILNDGIEFQSFNVRVNKAPFYDSDVKSTRNSTDQTVPIAAIPLNMYNPNGTKENKWTVKKTLTVSDCNEQHRLLISKKLMEGHILPYLNEASRLEISSLGGFRVNVFDCDVGVQVTLTLKKWATAKYYGLMDNWKRDFVVRRGLIPGDVVGICWDDVCKRLLFSVLKRWYD